MKQIIIISLFIILLPKISLSGDEIIEDLQHFEENQIFDTSSPLDSNIAFFEGEKSSYLISPPLGFVLEIQRAKMDGYSMTFIPLESSYDSSDVRIDVTIMKPPHGKKKKFRVNDFISDDSTLLIKHFGANIEFYMIDSILNNSNEKLITYYINDKTQFIPNVMVAYYYQSVELIIFELSISENYPRFVAEKLLIELVQNFKSLTKKEISFKD